MRKRVYNYDGGWEGTAEKDLRFIYDGWNVVLVLDDENEILTKYTWGLDLSQSVHGAGGIGGLLGAYETQGTATTADDKGYWFLYDGNGNVGQILETTGYTYAAKYEYDPYGNLIAATGTYASANPFRFSTKWFDDETGLGYWGYRYYAPGLGRWLNRDPIGEQGGRNLYGFVRNSPTRLSDAQGLSPTPIIPGSCPTCPPQTPPQSPSAPQPQCNVCCVKKTYGGFGTTKYKLITVPCYVIAAVGRDKVCQNLGNTKALPNWVCVTRMASATYSDCVLDCWNASIPAVTQTFVECVQKTGIIVAGGVGVVVANCVKLGPIGFVPCVEAAVGFGALVEGGCLGFCTTALATGAAGVGAVCAAGCAGL